MFLKIAEKLALAQAVVAVVIIGLALFAAQRVSGISQALTVVNDINAVKQRYAINFRGSVHDQAIALRDVVLVETMADVDATVREIERLRRFYDDSAGPLDRFFSDAGSRQTDEFAIRQDIAAIEARTRPLADRIIALRRAGDRETAHKLLLAEAKPIYEQSLARINNFIDLQEQKNQVLGGEARASAADFRAMILQIAVAAVVLALGIGFFIARSVTAPLGRMVTAMDDVSSGRFDTDIPQAPDRTEIGRMGNAMELLRGAAAERVKLEAEASARAVEASTRADTYSRVLAEVSQVVAQATAGQLDGRVRADGADSQLNRLADDMNRLMELFDRVIDDIGKLMARVADGDLSGRVDTRMTGVFGRLASDVNGSLEKLEELVSAIKSAAGRMSDAANSIVQDAKDLSMRTESQAASLEQTAAAMEEMSAAVRSSAEAAASASQLTGQTSSVAQRGVGVAAEAMDAMRLLDESSQKIGEITTLVDSIAFQTNLLALNASVEAARAGESGKGFAVVAQEVRALSQRTAEAASQIKKLISESSSHVVSGVGLVGGTSKSLEEIGDAIASMAEMIKGVSTASGEQSSTVQELSGAVSTIDKTTQENAALAMSSADAAAALQGEVGKLATLVAFFKDSHSDRGRRAA